MRFLVWCAYSLDMVFLPCWDVPGWLDIDFYQAGVQKVPLCPGVPTKKLIHSIAI